MAIYTTTTLDSVLKQLYKGQAVTDLVYNESARPFLSMLKKTQFVGRNYPLPIVYEDSPTSATFSTAQSNVAASKLEAFEITTVKDYAVGRIETEALLASRNDKGAFINGLKHNVDRAINALSNQVESALFRDGTGAIGRISSGYAGTTLTLTNSEDIVNFKVGQKIVSAASTTGALTSAAARTISAVDRDAGTVVISAALAGTAADNDYLFTEGDHVTASDNLKIKGLDAWIPSSAPSATAFFGVDRSVDPTRLGGVRYTGNAGAIEESIVGGAARLGRECGAVPDTALMSFQTFRRLVNEMGSKVQRSAGGLATGGFQTLEVYGPRGVIKCVPCTFCQNDVIWVLTLSTWEFCSMGEPVQILDHDGSKVLRVSDADALEVRVATYSNLACKAPGQNCRVAL